MSSSSTYFSYSRLQSGFLVNIDWSNMKLLLLKVKVSERKIRPSVYKPAMII